MADPKKGNNESTLLGLPEVPQTNSTQVMDATVRDPATSVPDVTAPSLAPVPEKPAVTTAPPRTKTGGIRTSETVSDAPRSKSSGAVPKAPEPRRASRVAVKAATLDATGEVSTDPNQKAVGPTSDELPNPNERTDPGANNIPTAITSPRAKPVKSTNPLAQIEWTMPKVAGVAAGVSLLFVLTWVFWPSGQKKKNPVAQVDDVADVDPSQPKPLAPKPAPKPVAPVVNKPPPKPAFALDAKKFVVDPYAVHMEDLPLDPAHKYRLTIARDDSRIGTALARLDAKDGWGVMNKMASHAALQFGGVKTLRLHCEPGSRFAEDQTFPLELSDLATKKSVQLKLNPALHCWDFEVMRTLELGEGVKKRIRVPTDSTAKLGEGVPLKIAYVIELLGEKKEWRTGLLNPGESVLAEGRLVRFAILDPYAADNEGSVDLELLSGDTESSGLVTPSTESGAKFVPTTK
ncbi:MAG: hypothetical protein U0228_38675 [Myxococcaceae bacterium]